MTAQSSTVEGTNDSYLKASFKQKDKFFRLYTPNYKGWRHTIYGDDLASVTSELTLRWPHVVDQEEEEEDYHWQARFCELAAYLEKEGRMS